MVCGAGVPSVMGLCFGYFADGITHTHAHDCWRKKSVAMYNNDSDDGTAPCPGCSLPGLLPAGPTGSASPEEGTGEKRPDWETWELGTGS